MYIYIYIYSVGVKYNVFTIIIEYLRDVDDRWFLILSDCRLRHRNVLLLFEFVIHFCVIVRKKTERTATDFIDLTAERGKGICVIFIYFFFPFFANFDRYTKYIYTYIFHTCSLIVCKRKKKFSRTPINELKKKKVQSDSYKNLK